MNYLNATPSTLFAAFSSTAITAVIAASILFGMAGLPGHDSAPSMAAAQLSVHG